MNVFNLNYGCFLCRSLLIFSLVLCGCNEGVYLNPQPTITEDTEDKTMSVQKFNYKGHDVLITPDDSNPKIIINSKDIPVSMNNINSYSAIQHLPYSSFSSLEDLARKVIDENLMN